MNYSDKKTIAIIGGGAAGFFGAITCATTNPNCRVIILEKHRQFLTKVRISGGGRCNVTHACFDAAKLVQNYPRGHKELLGPFSRFQPRDTIAWFEAHHVPLKTENDGRMFPTTDNSETIISCLLQQTRQLGIEIWTERGVVDCTKQEDKFVLTLSNEEQLTADGVLVATGGNSKILSWLEKFGHTLTPPVPSLFTFNLPNSPLHELAGVSVPHVKLTLEGFPQPQTGPLLVTHWGLSGPAVLKLSAWGARFLHAKDYQVMLYVNWLPEFSTSQLEEQLHTHRKSEGSRLLSTEAIGPLPKSLWKKLLEISGLPKEQRWATLSKEQMMRLTQTLHAFPLQIQGKSTNKDEFVTCGGVNLKEVNFKTMESRLCPGLYFAGEILDIDGITGGFNFQNAWTTSWLAGQALGRLQGE